MYGTFKLKCDESAESADGKFNFAKQGFFLFLFFLSGMVSVNSFY